MRVMKIVITLALIYAIIVILFELTLGYFQPENQSTFTITTTDAEGVSTERVLVRNISRGQLYASANHWPRAWYRTALENPNVRVTIDGVTDERLAVPIQLQEHERVDNDNPHGIGFMFLVGFAPRVFLRLEPL